MIFTLMPMNILAAGESAFKDITGSEYYAESAEKLSELGILAGYEDGTYGAEKTITRAEMAAIVCRILGKEADAEKAKGKTEFDDVAAAHWASGYINIATEEGIINGDGDGKFRPEDDVKYEEAIKMIVCTLGYKVEPASDAANWSKPYIEIADMNGITKNLKGTKGTPANRGDIAVMSYSGILAVVPASVAPATPVASVKEGEYKTTQKVKLTTTTKGAAIYYTTDGKTPTVKSTKYTKEISIGKNTTLKAIAVKDGTFFSEVMTVKYTFKKATGGGGGGGGYSSPVLRTANILVDNAANNGEKVKPGNTLTISVTDSGVTGYTVKWNVGGVVTEDDTYTVTNFDSGKTIKAEVTKGGTTITTPSVSVEEKITINLEAAAPSTGTLPSDPVVVSQAASYYNAAGEPTTIEAGSTVEFNIEAENYDMVTDTERIADTLTTAMTDKINEVMQTSGGNVTAQELENAFNFITVDAALQVTAPEATTAEEIHPVGDVILTFTAEQLGITLADGESLSDHYIVAYHENKKGQTETQIAEIVTDAIGTEYAQFKFNGLSIIWLGNCPPATVTFNTDGGTAIESQKVKFGGLVNTSLFENPTKNGYIFCGWNYDLAHLYIIQDLEVIAQWIEGTYLPASQFEGSWNVANGTEDFAVETKDGSVKITANPEIVYDEGISYSVTVSPYDGAVSYAVSASAEGAMALDEYQSVDNILKVTADVTDENGVIPGKTDAYIKWVDAEENVLALQAISITVDDGTGVAETMIYTADVNRGIGTFEAYLIDKDGSAEALEDYVAFINTYLSGTYKGYTLDTYASWDEYRINYDYSGYDTIKWVFTPFEGESFNSYSTKDFRYEYYSSDTWNEVNITPTITKSGENLIIEASLDISSLTAIGDVYLYGTIVADGKEQDISCDFWSYGTQEETQYVEATTWAEVLSYLNSGIAYSINYSGSEDVVIDSYVAIPANCDVSMYDTNVTIANGGTLMVMGQGSDYAAYFHAKNIVVQSGGTIATNSREESGSYTHAGVSVKNSIIFESGASLTIPTLGFLSFGGNTEWDSETQTSKNVATLTINTGVNVSVQQVLMINSFAEVNINSDISMNSTDWGNLYIRDNDAINIGGVITTAGNAYLELDGDVTIAETGGITINCTNRNRENEINGPLYNNGIINVNSGKLMLRNTGFASHNYGTISVASDSTIYLPGTKLINGGIINGNGVFECTLGDDYTTYDSGTEYVEVDNDEYYDAEKNERVYKLIDYSRYKFVRDPEATVDTTLYKGEIINEGTGSTANTVTVNTEEFPE